MHKLPIMNLILTEMEIYERRVRKKVVSSPATSMAHFRMLFLSHVIEQILIIKIVLGEFLMTRRLH